MADTAFIVLNIDVAIRNLEIVKEQLQKKQGTNLESSASDKTRILNKVKKIKSESADLTHMF